MNSESERDQDSVQEDEKKTKTDFQVALNEMSCVKKVIAVISGKGGVGKSMVSSMIALTLHRRGMSAAILDADLTGPSIPKIYGLKGKAMQNEFGILPMISKTGIKVMSLNCLIDHETDPVVWRGPLIAKTVQQFWTDVIWDDVDCMVIDMPPGTGDVPLTVFQSLPVDGIIIVTTPQDLVSMVVTKSVRMAEMMHIPIIGIVENMSFAICPHCGQTFSLFGKSQTETIAAEHYLPVLAKLPVDPKFANACDKGLIELMHDEEFIPVAEAIENWEEK